MIGGIFCECFLSAMLISGFIFEYSSGKSASLGDGTICDDNPDLCRMTPTSEICEGRGQCVCGQCSCIQVSINAPPERKYTGKFCECNDYVCDYHAGYMCGGPDQGVCMCGQCVCQMGWYGSRCECGSSDCEYHNGKMCGGNGVCVCGNCQCSPNFIGSACNIDLRNYPDK